MVAAAAALTAALRGRPGRFQLSVVQGALAAGRSALLPAEEHS